jgi:exonuclease III
MTQNLAMRFGIWNVLTLLQAGNINIIAEEAERYNMDVIALQEIRWKGKVSIKNRNSFYIIP